MRAEYKLPDLGTKGIRGKYLKRSHVAASVKSRRNKRPKPASKGRPSHQQRFRDYVRKKHYR